MTVPKVNDGSELGDGSTNEGWKKRIFSHVQRGSPRFIQMITSLCSGRSSIKNTVEGGDKSLKESKPPPTAISVNESRRKKEDNMAIIFLGFITVFLICHLPRLLLNIHELFTIQGAIMCMEANKKPFPIWSLVMIR